jgi:hypothetical protein
MYTSINFKSKKDLKAAVAEGKIVTLFAPGIGQPPTNGTCCVEGPHYPQPHKFYAEVTVKDGRVIKVK